MSETKLSRLSGRYLAALRIHFEQSPQGSLQLAHDLGLQAAAIGLETLELARIHDLALLELVSPDCAAIERGDIIRLAVAFFAEAIMPVEETHRLALEAGAALPPPNETAVPPGAGSQGTAPRRAVADLLKANETGSARLLREARELQKHLQDLVRRILTVHEDERKRMSLKLQDEIVQTLLALHLRLQVMDKGLSVSAEEFKKEIASTQQLVEESVKTINRFVREFGIVYEN